MKCVYCNSDENLTSSDIITYAITGAKLTKPFVCKTHNAFTNDNYEKKFVSELDFFRYHLGFSTRDGNPIKYKADLTVDGINIKGVTLSNREAFYAPKSVISGKDEQGHKTILGPANRIEKISKGKGKRVNVLNIEMKKTINSDCFFGYYAIRSIAKIAYEWYCYNNQIEEYKDEYEDIVNYILNKTDGDYVDIVVDGNYYYAIDELSETGTNSFFQYDDTDGYRYVVFDFWNTISYRIRISKSPNITPNENHSFFNLFRYHIDGRITKKVFGTFSLGQAKKKQIIKTVNPKKIDGEVSKAFVERINRIMTTLIFSIYSLKKEVDLLSESLKRYDEGKINFSQLTGFEENRIVFTIELITLLYKNREKYDMSKSFNQNKSNFLMMEGETINRTEEDKHKFLRKLSVKDKNKELSDYLWKSIKNFNIIYDKEINQTN